MKVSTLMSQDHIYAPPIATGCETIEIAFKVDSMNLKKSIEDYLFKIGSSYGQSLIWNFETLQNLKRPQKTFVCCVRTSNELCFALVKEFIEGMNLTIMSFQDRSYQQSYNVVNSQGRPYSILEANTVARQNDFENEPNDNKRKIHIYKNEYFSKIDQFQHGSQIEAQNPVINRILMERESEITRSHQRLSPNLEMVSYPQISDFRNNGKKRVKKVITILNSKNIKNSVNSENGIRTCFLGGIKEMDHSHLNIRINAHKKPTQRQIQQAKFVFDKMRKQVDIQQKYNKEQRPYDSSTKIGAPVPEIFQEDPFYTSLAQENFRGSDPKEIKSGFLTQGDGRDLLKPNRESCVVYIKGIDQENITLNQICNLMECFGLVEKAMFHCTKQYTLLQFSDHAGVKMAMKELYGKEISGNKLLLHQSEFDSIETKYYTNEKIYYAPDKELRNHFPVSQPSGISRLILLNVYFTKNPRIMSLNQMNSILFANLPSSALLTGGFLTPNSFQIEFLNTKQSIDFVMKNNYQEIVEENIVIVVSFVSRTPPHSDLKY